jgi:protein farnesyltransferase/geranylgeranyltransferase type-1 subunit alpha
LEVAQRECDFSIEQGVTLDPYNESPWRYLIGVLKEQLRLNTDLSPEESSQLMECYNTKVEGLRVALEEEGGNPNPDSCTHWTSARIDLLELKGDKDSLNKVRFF